MKKVFLEMPSMLIYFLCAFLLLVEISFARAQNIEPIQNETKNITAFADPKEVWGNGVEAVIERAFRQCFKSYFIDGQLVNVRMPFAENHERDQLVDGGWEFLGKGKSAPPLLWPVINSTLQSSDFAKYIEALKSGKEQVIIFDIASQKWDVSFDIFDIARMKAGSYHGLPHKPYVLVNGKGVKESDVYNYLYCIAWTGLDCSGFVWYTLSYIAEQRGINLGQALRRSLGMPSGGTAANFAGTSFYNSPSSEIIAVDDKIKNLRSGDIMLFRWTDGTMAHSAIIQSVNFSSGVIRYLQDTDEAPQEERGVHDSYIYFNPKKTNLSLQDESLQWSQKRFSPFPGERESAFSDDGQRYRAYGGGRVVRLRIMASLQGTPN
ncbi:MAG: hypothetical protein Ta2G_19150 [Termitinemataceae bacterium]|nr:MAG: hypothetical protein Ta2G_19150 [Termitinemataceae bacterium]